MDTKEVFFTILDVCSEACCVSRDDVLSSKISKDASRARGLTIFWLDAMEFETKEIMKYANKKNANSINSIRKRIEPAWKDCALFRLLVLHTRDKLIEIAKQNSYEFDFDKPINHIRKITGKN